MPPARQHRRKHFRTVADANTLLLCHFNKNDGVTDFSGEDVSTGGVDSPHTVTPGGTVAYDNAANMGGDWGNNVYFGVDQSGALTLADSTDWQFGQGPLTIEMFVRFVSASSYNALFSSANDVAGGFSIYQHHDLSRLYLQFYGGTSPYWSWVAGTGVWYHFAVVFSAGAWNVFVDGAALGGGYSYNPTLGNNQGLWIGQRHGGSGMHYGWLEEYRISNVARDPAAFPPAAPYA